MAEFGTPETWNMKVGDFIETQLPKEKPQALLDLQEQNRNGHAEVSDSPARDIWFLHMMD